MKIKNKVLYPLCAILLFSLVFLFPACSKQSVNKPVEISLSQAIQISRSNNIEKLLFEPNNNRLIITLGETAILPSLKDIQGNPVVPQAGMNLNVAVDNLNLVDLQSLGFVLPAEYSTSLATDFKLADKIIYLGTPFLSLLTVTWVLLQFRRQRVSTEKSVSEKRLPEKYSKPDLAAGVTARFSSVAGADEAKQELREIVDFLKNPAKFNLLGARIPKGVLLIGPPGTGKTLLARAVAGEAGVPFYSAVGSEFVEVYVGLGASRVRDIFAQARKNAPSIIFIDEIDAIGYQRSKNSSVHESEQTLNQILAEMDGFDNNSGVIVLAATNRPDVLDAALLRPGRFDRQVTLGLPDKKGRKSILEVHSAGKPLENGVNLEDLAKESHGLSGAELANVFNEAAILAARREKSLIGMAELDEALDKVLAGPRQKIQTVNNQDKKIRAFHEAGHALVAHLLPDADPVHKVTIVARGNLGGFTRLLPAEERQLMTKSRLKACLATLLGGYSAEEIIFNEVSTGSQNDLKQVTGLARKMITEYGMSQNFAPRTFGQALELSGSGEDPSQYRDYSEEVCRDIDRETNQLIEEAHLKARGIILENRSGLLVIAEKLIVEETLEGPDLKEVFSKSLPEVEKGMVAV